MQSLIDVAPVPTSYVPAGHVDQPEVPEIIYEPAGQLDTHADEPANEYFPVSHGVQLSELFIFENVPDGHLIQDKPCI